MAHSFSFIVVSSGAGYQVHGHVVATGPGKHYVSLVQDPGVYSIGHCALLGEHSGCPHWMQGLLGSSAGALARAVD